MPQPSDQPIRMAFSDASSTKSAAGISAVRYGRFGFIGLYICHPEFRGQGLGRQVWDAGMAHLAVGSSGLTV